MRFTAALFLILSACATSVPPQASAVRVTANPDVVRPCQFIANVSARAVNGFATTPAERAQLRLQQRALEAGGDTVFLTSATSNGNVSDASGEAYRCSGHELQP